MRSHHRPLDKPFLNYNVFKSCQKLCFLKRRWPHTFFFNFFDFFGSPKNFFIFRFFPFHQKKKRGKGLLGRQQGDGSGGSGVREGGPAKRDLPSRTTGPGATGGRVSRGGGCGGAKRPGGGRREGKGKGGKGPPSKHSLPPFPPLLPPPSPPRGGGPFFHSFHLWQAEKLIFFFSFLLQSCLLLLLLPVVRLPGKSTSSIVAGRRVPPSRERRWNVA